MRMVGLLLPLVLFGCRGDYSTVEEACPKRTRSGGLEANDLNFDSVHYLNCYRRLATVDKGGLHKGMNKAVEGHVAYLLLNDVASWGVTDEDWGNEVSGNPGFKGITPWDRYKVFDYDASEPDFTGLWFAIDYAGGRGLGLRGRDRIDYYMAWPFWREALLQIEWSDGGVGESAPDQRGWRYWELDILYRFPSEAHENKPVVYPKDGQVGVPTNYNWTGTEQIFGYDLGVAGYAITVSVGSDESESNWGATNPYELFTISKSLRGPDGDIELIELTPSLDFSRWTLIYIPVEELDPQTEYTFEATVEWNWGRRDVVSKFKTGDQLDERFLRQPRPDQTGAALFHVDKTGRVDRMGLHRFKQALPK